MEFGLTDFLFTTIIGAGVGVVAGMFGVGGGFLIVPLLNIVLGVPVQMAVGSAACQVLGPATTSVLARRVRAADFKLPLITLAGLGVGIFAGANLLHRLSVPSPNSSMTVSSETVVLVVYLLLLLMLGAFSLWESQREIAGRPIETGWCSRLRIPPFGAVKGAKAQLSIPVIAWFGLSVGFLSGLLGISGGLLLLPGLVYLLGIDWHRAVTASMLIVWAVAVQSTIAHSLHHHISLPIVIGLLLGGTVGARLGVSWSRGLSPVRGRQSFGWLALGTAGMIAYRLAS